MIKFTNTPRILMASRRYNNPVISVIWVALGLATLISISLGSFNRDTTQRLYLRRRLQIDNRNDSAKYEDFLTITNYRAHPKSAMELFNMAREYIDTVHSDREVTAVTFLDLNSTKRIRSFDSQMDFVERPYSIINLNFNRENRINGEPRERPLNSIALFTNGEVHFYYRGFFVKSEPQTKMLDSVLNSLLPILPER